MDTERILDIQKDLRQFQHIPSNFTLSLLKFLEDANLEKIQLKQTKITQTVASLSKYQPTEKQKQDKLFQQIITTSQNLINQWKKKFESQNPSNILKQQNRKISQQVKKSPTKQIQPESIDITPINEYLELEPQKRNQILTNIYRNFMTLQPKSDKIKITPEIIVPLVVEIEQELWKYNQKFDSNLIERNYTEGARKLLKSFKNNRTLGINIVAKQYTPQQVGSLDDELFLTEEQKKQIAKIKIQEEIASDANYSKKKLEKQRESNSEGEECPFCKKKEAFCYHEQQIRGADEPMTRFMRCGNCEKQWDD